MMVHGIWFDLLHRFLPDVEFSVVIAKKVIQEAQEHQCEAGGSMSGLFLEFAA